MAPKARGGGGGFGEAAPPPEVVEAQGAWAEFRRGDAEALKHLQRLARERPSAAALVLLAKAELLRVVERADQVGGRLPWPCCLLLLLQVEGQGSGSGRQLGNRGRCHDGVSFLSAAYSGVGLRPASRHALPGACVCSCPRWCPQRQRGSRPARGC